ncbi:3-dehydroquinate dehydratase [Microbacterium sp. zg.Y625]|uniref:type II 3-dehydroquinate dehydratase n=1 Tax=Microbacterium jiangjiandongii TaxID=3049071 RepID=UPI00214C4EAB|nr:MULTISPECIES: type II 3-dehydroquinate dehydratase [unclassified Microbacterium]MCR2794095.1 3-dehydroquinate dehydratase [Microbacterium sp. zg.Y625]WIM25700.1 type II 3-dehydroquinate dehydratase [Microbacterium sp. zg-Y625]
MADTKAGMVPGRLFVLNGPNLNMLGLREPGVYGRATIEDIEACCRRTAAELGFDVFFGQTSAEHQLVDWVHDAFRQSAAVVINPAGYSFTSVALLDALRMLETPIVEVHITNIHSRGEVYQRSLVSTVAGAVIAGAGPYGYDLAIRTISRLTREAVV